MEESGVLAHLAHRFKVGKEPIATQALCYLAQSHEPIRASLAALAGHGGHAPEVLDRVRFRAEPVSAFADGRPDIEGAAGNSTLVIIEGKFDAGLTAHQPVSYLKRLAVGGTLVFVCPGWRVAGLLYEVTQRAQEAGFVPVGGPETNENGIHWQQLADGNKLAAVGWADLLDWLAGRLPTDESAARCDVGQIRGLAARFEMELMEWTQSQLETPGLDGFGTAFDKGFLSAKIAAETLKRHKDVHDPGKLSWAVVENSFYSLTAKVGQVTVLIGFSPTDWGPSCPTPLQFVVSQRGLTADQLDGAYQAYVDIMEFINMRLAKDFAGLAFPPYGPSATYWWGPLPLAFDVPELEMRADLKNTIAVIVTAILLRGKTRDLH